MKKAICAFVVVALHVSTLAIAQVPDESRGPREANAGSIVDDSLYLLPDFKSEVIYRHPHEQGSWVSLTTDDRGRLITSNVRGGLFRITLASEGSALDVQKLDVEIGGIQGLLYAFDSLYAVVNHGEESGLYRLRDTTGDDNFDEVKLLRALEGEIEHGPHGVILSPDGKGLYIISGNQARLPDPEKSAGPRNWADDGLLSFGQRYGGGIDEDRPGGWVCRTDPDGKTFEIVATGFRNSYNSAFNADGELFTYDSDMEYDMGLPWYRPTRVNHITSGAEFGWRGSNRKWPDYYFDSLGAVHNIGAGSPTGLVFGYGAKFPAKHQRALFMCDWSYGNIYAVYIKPQGASYVAEAEVFLSGSPLPVTDVVVHPDDGALYFVTGGRGTSSALYRVTYTGEESTEQVSYTAPEFAEDRAERRRIEQFHGEPNSQAVDAVWPSLASEDRHIRFAARVALEIQPLGQWIERAFEETNARRAIAALAAVARTASPELQERMVGALVRIEWDRLSDDDRVDLLRVFFLTFSRLGTPDEDDRAAAIEYLNPRFPSTEWRANRELGQILAYLNAPGLVDRMIDVIRKEISQEDKLYFIQCLSTIKEEQWNIEQHREYMSWFSKIFLMGGGVEANDYIVRTKNVAIDNLSDERKTALDDVINAPLPPDPYTELQARDFVKQWTVEELLALADAQMTGRDFRQGQRIYGEALCMKCHRFNGRGGSTGPDLTGVSARYDNRSLIESLVAPDKVIPDQYSSVTILKKDGTVSTGRIGDIETQSLQLMTDVFNPSALESIRNSEIEEIRTSAISTMPTGLLDTFTQEQILDLIAYLKSRGNPDHEIFSR